jgi:hypothetical protein
MTIQANSRFITYPSTVEKSNNHTVVLVDADVNDIEDIGLFCKVSNKDYDIYLYKADVDDLQWLGHISQLADHILISDASTIQSPSNNLSVYGKTCDLTNPLDYFLHHEEN